MLPYILIALCFANWVLGQSSTTASSSPASSQDASSTTTSNYPTATLLMVGNITTGFDGALIHASACYTTYGLSCTDNNLCSTYTATVTQGPFDYVVDLYSSYAGTVAYVSQSCSLVNLGVAVCPYYASVSVNGSTTTTVDTTTVSGSQLAYNQVPITVGGDRLAAAAAACSSSTPSQTAASSHQHGDSATKIGVGVGVGVGGTLIIVGLVIGTLWYRRRRRSRGKQNKAPEAPNYAPDEKRLPDLPNGLYGQGQQVPVMAEMSASTPVVEPADDAKWHELAEDKAVAAPAQPMSPQELPGDTQPRKQ